MFYIQDSKQQFRPVSDIDLWFWHSYALRNFYILNHFDCTNEKLISAQKRNSLLLQSFLKMNFILKQKMKDTQFCIFVYDGDKYIKQIEQDLLNNGIKVIYLSDLSNIDFSSKEYRLENDLHPNSLAWKIIVPLLVKELNL